MTLTITSKQFKQLWKKANDKRCDNPRIKDRAWAACQVIQFLGGKEYNYNLLKDLNLK